MGNETSYARDLEIDIGEYAVKVPENEIPLVMKFADDKRDDEQKEQARKAAENQEKVEEQQKLFLKKALALNNLSLMLNNNNNNNNNSNLHLGNSSKLLTSGRGLSSPRLFSRGGGGGDSNSSGSSTFRHFSFNSGNSRNNNGGGGGGSRSRSNSLGQQQQPNDFTGNPISDRDSFSDSSSENSSSFSMTPTYSTPTSSVSGVSMSQQQQQQTQTKQPFLPKLNISDMADRLNEADLEMNGSGTPRKTSRFLGSARNIASLITPRKSMKSNVALSNNSRSRSHSTASHISDYYPNIVLEKTEDIQTMDFTDRSERDEMSSYGDEAPQIMRGGRELSSLFSSVSSSQTFTASPFLKTNLESSLQFTDAESVSSEGESDSDTSDDELESEMESEIGTPVLTPNSHEVFSTPKRNRFSQVGNSPELSDRSSFTNDNDSSTNKRDSKLNRLSRRFVQSVRGLPGLGKAKKEKKSKSESKGKSSGQILFDKYFSLEKRETLIQYMNSLLTGRELQKARKLIRNEICAIDPNCDHARKMIQHEIRNGRIDNAMDIIHHHNYLRVPVPCEESEFEDALGSLSPNFIPSILSFRNFLVKQKKRQQMELAISNNKRALADYENDDFDNVAVVELIIKWIQVILHKHDPNSNLKISNILTLKELNYMYMIIDNHYRFPFPLSQAELEQNQAKLAQSLDQTQANCYIHTSLVISMSYKVLKQLQTQRKEDIEKLQCTQSATATTTVVVYVADLFSNVTTVQAVIRSALCENGVSNFKRLSSHIIAQTQRQMSTNTFIQISPILSKAKQYFVAQSKKTSFRTCSILLRVNSSAVRTNDLVDTLKLNACSMRCLVQQSHIHHSSQVRTLASSVRTQCVIADHVFPDDIQLLQAQARVHEQRGDQIMLIQRVMRGGKGVLEHADNFRRVICVESTIRTFLIDIARIHSMISIILTLTKANEGVMISPIQTTAASASIAVCETIGVCTTVQSVLRGRCENLNFRSIQSLQATIRSTLSKKNVVFLWIERAQDEIEDDFHLSFSASFRPIGLKQVAAQQSIVEQTHLLQATLKQKFERFRCPFTKGPLLNDQHSELTQYVIMLQSVMRSEERDILDSISRLQATLTSYGACKVSLAREFLITQSFLRTCLYLRSDRECIWLQSNIRQNTVRHIDQFGMLQHLIRGCASKSIDEARANCNKLIGAAIRVGLSRTSNTEFLRLQSVIRTDNTHCRFWHAKAVQSVFRVRPTDFLNIRHIQSVIRMKSLSALCGDSQKSLDELTYLNSVMIVQALVRRRSEDPAPPRMSTIQAVIRKTRSFRSVSNVSVLQALVKPQFDPSTLSWLYASVKQSITPPFDTIQVDTLHQLIISGTQRYNRYTLDSFTIILQSLIRSVILSYQQNYGTIHAIARMNTINSQGGLMELSVLQSFMKLCAEQLTSAQFGCQLSSLQCVVKHKSQINSSDLSTQLGPIQAISRRSPPNTLALLLPTIQKSAQSQIVLSKIRDIQDIFRSKSVPIGPYIVSCVTLESQIRTQQCRSEHLTSNVIVLESLLRSNPINTQHLQDLVSVQSLIRLKFKQQDIYDTLSSMLRMYIEENKYYARSIEIDRLHSIILSPSLLSFQEIDVIQANVLRYFVETSKNSLGMIQHCVQLRSSVTQVEVLQSSIRLFNILLHNSGRHSCMLMLQNIFHHPIDESCTALEQILPIESIMRSNTITPVISQLADDILPILSIMRKNNHDHNSDNVLNASIRMKSTHNKEVESLSAIQILSAHHLSDYNLCSHMQRLHDTELIQYHIRSLSQEIRTEEALVVESSIRSLTLLPFNSVLSLQSMIRLKLHPHVSLSTLRAAIQLRLFRLEIVNSSVERIQSLIIACPSNNIRMVRAIQAVFVEKLVALSTRDLNLSPTQGLEHSREVRIVQGAFRARSFISDHSHSYLITNLLTGLITRTNILSPSIHDKITGVLTIDSIVRSRAVELGHSTLSPHILSIQSAAMSQPVRDVSCEKLCSVFRSLLSTQNDAWVDSLQSIIRSSICITQCRSEYANTVAIESMMHKNEVNNAFWLARRDLMRIESILHSDTLALDLSSSKIKHIQALMKRECRTTEIIRSQALVLNVIHRTAAAQHMLWCVAIVQSAVHSRICVVDYSSRRESVLSLIDILGNDNPSTHHQNLTMNTKVSAIASVIRTQSCALSHIKLIQSVIGMRMGQFSLYDVLGSVIRMVERKNEHLIVLTEQRQLSSLISMKLITPMSTQYLSDTQSLQSLARLSLVQSDYEMWNTFKQHLRRALRNHSHSVHGLQPLFGVIRTCQTLSDLVSQHQRIDTLQAILRQNKFICSNRNLNIISRCTAIQATIRMRTATDTVCSFAHIPPILERYLINSRVKLICRLCSSKDDQITSVSRLQSIMRGAVNTIQYQEKTLRMIQSTLQRDNYMNRFLPIQSQLQCHLLDMGSITQLQAAIREHVMKQSLRRQTSIIQATSVRLAQCLMLENVSKHLMAIQASCSTDPLTLNNTKRLFTIQNLTITNLEESKLHYSKDSLGVVESAIRTMSVHVTDPGRDTCCVQAMTRKQNVLATGDYLLPLQSSIRSSLHVPCNHISVIQPVLRISTTDIRSSRFHDPSITMIQSVIRSAVENSIHDMLAWSAELSALLMSSESSRVLDVCQIQAHLRNSQAEQSKLNDQLALQSSIRAHSCVCTTKSIETLQSIFSQVHNRMDEDEIIGIETIQAIMRSNATYSTFDTVAYRLSQLREIIRSSNNEMMDASYRSLRNIHDQANCTLASSEMSQIQCAIECLEGLCRMSSHNTSLVVRTSALIRGGLQSGHPAEYHNCCEIQAMLRSSCASNMVEHIGGQILTLQSRIRSSLHPPHNHICSIQSAIRMNVVDVRLSGYHEPNITVIQSMIRIASENSIHDMLPYLEILSMLFLPSEQSRVLDMCQIQAHIRNQDRKPIESPSLYDRLQSSIRTRFCVYATKSIDTLQSKFSQVHNRMDEDAITGIETIQAIMRSNATYLLMDTVADHMSKLQRVIPSSNQTTSSTYRAIQTIHDQTECTLVFSEMNHTQYTIEGLEGLCRMSSSSLDTSLVVRTSALIRTGLLSSHLGEHQSCCTIQALVRSCVISMIEHPESALLLCKQLLTLQAEIRSSLHVPCNHICVIQPALSMSITEVDSSPTITMIQSMIRSASENSIRDKFTFFDRLSVLFMPSEPPRVLDVCQIQARLRNSQAEQSKINDQLALQSSIRAHSCVCTTKSIETLQNKFSQMHNRIEDTILGIGIIQSLMTWLPIYQHTIYVPCQLSKLQQAIRSSTYEPASPYCAIRNIHDQTKCALSSSEMNQTRYAIECLEGLCQMKLHDTPPVDGIYALIRMRLLSDHSTEYQGCCTVQALTHSSNVNNKVKHIGTQILTLQSTIHPSLQVPFDRAVSEIQSAIRMVHSNRHHDPNITMIQSVIRSSSENSIHDMLTDLDKLFTLFLPSEPSRVLDICLIQAHLRYQAREQIESPRLYDQLVLQSSIRTRFCVYATKSIDTLQSKFSQVHNRMDEDTITGIETIQSLIRSDSKYPSMDTVTDHLCNLQQVIHWPNCETVRNAYRSIRSIHDQTKCTLALNEMTQIQYAIEGLEGLCRMSSLDTSLVVRTSALIRTGLQSGHPVEDHDCCKIQALLRSSCANSKVEHIGAQILTLQSRIRSSLHPPHNHICSIQSAIRIVDVRLSSYHDPNITVIQSMIRIASENSIHDMWTRSAELSALLVSPESSRVLDVCQIQAHLRNSQAEQSKLNDQLALQSSIRAHSCVCTTKSIETLQSIFSQVHNRMDEDVQALLRSSIDNSSLSLSTTSAGHEIKTDTSYESNHISISSTKTNRMLVSTLDLLSLHSLDYSRAVLPDATVSSSVTSPEFGDSSEVISPSRVTDKEKCHDNDLANVCSIDAEVDEVIEPSELTVDSLSNAPSIESSSETNIVQSPSLTPATVSSSRRSCVSTILRMLTLILSTVIATLVFMVIFDWPNTHSHSYHHFKSS